jgi:hypothetical protein
MGGKESGCPDLWDPLYLLWLMAGRGYHIPDPEVPFYDYQVSSWLMLDSRDMGAPYQGLYALAVQAHRTTR